MSLNLSLTRREALKTLAVAGVVAAVPRALAQTGAGVSTRAILDYLQTLRKEDGGYGWEDQVLSHLTPTFGVIGCHRLLKTPPPERTQLAAWVRTHHPRELKKLEQERRVFEFQQVQALSWLGEDVASFRETFASPKWMTPLAYMKAYEQHGYPVFQSELGAILARPLLGLPVEGLGDFVTYIDARRRANGSFNNTPTADGGDGHVMNTYWGVQALKIFGRGGEKKAETIAWLRACQLPNGGFTHAPKAEIGGVDDIAYTRAATRCLALLGGTVANREACIAYVHSLANADGGFSDRPGWYSNPLATFYALDTLDALGAIDTLGKAKLRARRTPAKIPDNLKAYTIQIESHGQGSPQDTVELARSLKIDFWGAKNAKPEWIARVRELAKQRNVPVTFFTANEEYGTWVDVPGLGTYSHTADLIAPYGADIGPALGSRGGPRSSPAVSWPDFQKRRLVPLEKAGGRLIWQFGENEELVRMFLDDSIERGGFAAISTYHFGNPDFTNSEPFLHRWRGKIPYIAIQDAHGVEPWFFSDQTSGFRTVFLAAEPTWDGWLNALKQNWVVPVRRDVWTKGKTWTHSGSREVRDAVLARESQWRWWDNPAISRPMVSLVAVTPADELEAGKPERGVTLRARCAWTNTPQGVAKEPISEFVRLTLDGKEAKPTLVEKKNQNGYLDHAYHLAVPDIAPGKHTATAVVRVVATKAEVTQRIEFTV
ncbi:MAG: prenyltransferase/squalene oxidase repeat-containing protein [Verrucomicrobiota bacterium]